MGPATIEILRDHFERQQSERIASKDKWQENNLIFTNHIGGAIEYRNLIRDFQLLLKNAGLPHIRFHDIRHTCASLMLNHGVPVLTVSRRLGHAKPIITLDVYGHLMGTAQLGAAQLMDEIVTPVELHTNGTRMAHEIPQLLDIPKRTAIYEGKN